MIRFLLDICTIRAGWRGSSGYDGDERYPGGVVSPGQDNELDLFTRVTNSNLLRVTVIGPDPNTAWNYRIRCRDPSQTNLFSEGKEEGLGFEWSEGDDKEPKDGS
jgi:hypothetical protein